ncbi:DNA methyltransferase [Arthrobacter sp. StoSoilB20]|uniref:class I SAM-dependent DNA methyltransferase n=1 Tax=Arthrobacter sp. StoSoilB20 TaxID=2830995 RepID=UPI001CC8019B|nr:DNA methyltransferase [Arthrobacter sp. StoSoilB20]BCW57850.1 putative DNA methyltransferase YeeA [Arthrobacter sp. StoSoilB20]
MSELLKLIESNDYQTLFLRHLRWSRPDLQTISTNNGKSQSLTAKNVSSYKGLRVWVCSELPDSNGQAALDRSIAAKSTDRLVIFHNEHQQVWRWPVRTVKGSSVVHRLSSHRHVNGQSNPKLLNRLETITLPVAQELGVTDVLERLRQAFDVETERETKRASRLMAAMFDALTKAEVNEHETSVTLARSLFLMFGDDTDMWDKNLFQDFIINHTRSDGSDIASKLNELFVQLDTPDVNRVETTPAFNKFPYVNGGVFTEPIKLPDTVGKAFRDAILEASKPDWSDISPAIFGSMFQSVRDAKTRREFGEHYTSERDILRTLEPLFLEDFRERFSAAIGHREESSKLEKLREDLAKVKFLDPACGCGNFIVISYRELRMLEIDILERLKALEHRRGNEAGSQLEVHLGIDTDVFGRRSFLSPKVSLENFFGIEIDEWPARIAETAMFLIERQCDMRMLERLGWAPTRLPIARAATIATSTPDYPDGGNALRLEWKTLFTPDDRTVIAGNPPYLGKTQRSSDQTADMKRVWGSSYSGELDFVTSWFPKAAEFLRGTGARFAFVTTNSIHQGVSVANLYGPAWFDGWSIEFAYPTFPWDGQAGVHCSISGYAEHPRERMLFRPDDQGGFQPHKVPNINPYLAAARDVMVQEIRIPRSKHLEKDLRFGSMPADGGHLIVDKEQVALFKQDPIAAPFLRSFVGSKELVQNRERWCIWMPVRDEFALHNSDILRERIEAVAQYRDDPRKDKGVYADRHNAHRFHRVKDRTASYLCIPRVVSENRKYFTAARFGPEVIASDAVFTAPDEDGFLFGLISSSMFIAWQKSIGGRLKSDYRFSSTIVWNNFPLKSVTSEDRQAVIDAGNLVLAAREEHPGLSLAQLYDPKKMPTNLQQAHEHLDEVVDPLFGLDDEPSEERRQQCLFDRYAELTGQ